MDADGSLDEIIEIVLDLCHGLTENEYIEREPAKENEMGMKDLDTQESRMDEGQDLGNLLEARLIAQEMAWGFPTGESDEPRQFPAEV